MLWIIVCSSKTTVNQLNFKENETNNKDVYESPFLISGFFLFPERNNWRERNYSLIDWLRKPRKGIIVRVYMYTVLMFYAFIQCFQRLTAIHSSAVMTAYHLYSIGYFSIWQTWVSLLPTNSQWCGMSQVILTCSNNSVPTSNIGMVITFSKGYWEDHRT